MVPEALAIVLYEVIYPACNEAGPKVLDVEFHVCIEALIHHYFVKPLMPGGFMFIYKQCPSLFVLRENRLTKTRNLSVLERSWTGSVLVQSCDQEIIPNTDELFCSEGLMINCFAQRLNKVFARLDFSNCLMSSGFISLMLPSTFRVV